MKKYLPSLLSMFLVCCSINAVRTAPVCEADIQPTGADSSMVVKKICRDQVIETIPVDSVMPLVQRVKNNLLYMRNKHDRENRGTTLFFTYELISIDLFPFLCLSKNGDIEDIKEIKYFYSKDFTYKGRYIITKQGLHRVQIAVLYYSSKWGRVPTVRNYKLYSFTINNNGEWVLEDHSTITVQMTLNNMESGCYICK